VRRLPVVALLVALFTFGWAADASRRQVTRCCP
jgi:hypothetical protein